MRLLVFLFALLPSTAAELIDRVAVSVGTTVITESELLEQMRLRALLEDIPLALDGESKRDAADRLIQQTLIRREIETTRYVIPDSEEAAKLLAGFKRSRFQDDEMLYRAALRKSRVTADEVLAGFLWQLTVLRFIEFRFRPGVQITPTELRDHYDRKFLPAWRERTTDPPPSLADATPEIEETLVQERIDNQLDRWISLSRTQVSIRYSEEVFEGS